MVGVATVGVAEGDRGADARRPLYVEDLGAGGATLVFLPGIGATTRYWKARVAPLAARARVVLVDLLGFGRSPKPWTRYTVERHVAELHRVLAGRAPFTLVGHSLGARLAVAYAAVHPRDVERLVLVSLPYYGGPERAKQYLRESSRHHWVWTNMAVAAVVCVLSRRLLGWLFPRFLPALPREVAEDLTQMTWRSSTSTLWEVLYRHDLSPDLARLPASLPVLLLHGERDTTAPVAAVRGLIAAHPAWVLDVLPGGDHNPLLQDAAWVRDAIARGARRDEPARAARG